LLAEKAEPLSTSDSSQDGSESHHYSGNVVKVVNNSALGLGQQTADATSVPATALQTITMTNTGTAGGTIVQYAQSQDGQQFFVPGEAGEINAYSSEPSVCSFAFLMTFIKRCLCTFSLLVGSGELQAYTIRPVTSTPSSPSVVVSGSGHGEEVTRKREIRLLKNREAARECRRKKKEYIKCLENRVAVLENQNKALIDELKALKELYCQQKTE